MNEQSEIKLNNGEVICNRCDGHGYEGKPEKVDYGTPVCKKCLGYKKLTWTEHIIGKRSYYGGDVTGYSGIVSTSSLVNSTSTFYSSGVLDPNGNINISPYSSSVSKYVSGSIINPKVPISSKSNEYDIEEVKKSE